MPTGYFIWTMNASKLLFLRFSFVFIISTLCGLDDAIYHVTLPVLLLPFWQVRFNSFYFQILVLLIADLGLVIDSLHSRLPEGHRVHCQQNKRGWSQWLLNREGEAEKYLVFHGTLNGMHTWIWLINWKENSKPDIPSPITKIAHKANKRCYNMVVQLILQFLCGITVTGSSNAIPFLF